MEKNRGGGITEDWWPVFTRFMKGAENRPIREINCKKKSRNRNNFGEDRDYEPTQTRQQLRKETASTPRVR